MLPTIVIFSLLCLTIQSCYWAFIFNRIKGSAYVSTVVDRQLSLIVCVKNAMAIITKHAELALQQNSIDEIIYIDDNSTDGSWILLNKLADQNTKLSCHQNPHQGKKSALAYGISKANNEWILLTDVDCNPASARWAELMSFATLEHDIILGHAPYNPKLGLLNKLIRFENIMNSIFSFAAVEIKIPYTGVGRNLLYKKNIYTPDLKASHLPYGDDDLLINAIAKKNNTNYCIDQDSFVYTEAKSNYLDYYLQKWRHYATASYYTYPSKIYLLLYFVSLIGFYFLLITLIFYNSYLLAIIFYLIRLTIQFINLKKLTKLFHELDLIHSFFIIEILYILHLIIQLPLLLYKKKSW